MFNVIPPELQEIHSKQVDEACKGYEEALGSSLPMCIKYFWKIVGSVQFGPRDWGDKDYAKFWITGPPPNPLAIHSHHTGMYWL